MSIEFDGEFLVCPSCGGIYLHQERTSVFSRVEDAETCMETTVVDKDNFDVPAIVFVQNNNNTRNPSPRRHGLKIDFRCEEGCYVSLAVFQHKGNTFVKWQRKNYEQK
jgi:hypothetical protein